VRNSNHNATQQYNSLLNTPNLAIFLAHRHFAPSMPDKEELLGQPRYVRFRDSQWRRIDAIAKMLDRDWTWVVRRGMDLSMDQLEAEALEAKKKSK
jgi:hypothetical protein